MAILKNVIDYMSSSGKNFSSHSFVLPSLAWVKHRTELSDVPLLCKEGRRGGSLFAAFNS
jgi:hypothetical protein